VAHALREALSPGLLNQLKREVKQSVRLRVVTPSRLISALVGALAGGACESIADILREFNLQQRTSTRYKAFYNRLARPGFPALVRSVVSRALGSLAVRVLEPVAGSPLRVFSDIVIHDGSSFALKDDLAAIYPGRFTKNGAAAVELHASFSGFGDEVFAVSLAPDTAQNDLFYPRRRSFEASCCSLTEDTAQPTTSTQYISTVGTSLSASPSPSISGLSRAGAEPGDTFCDVRDVSQS
jgi:hypothetical protein